MESVQIKGVDSTLRETRATLEAGAKYIVTERLMTHGNQTAVSNMVIELNGEDASAQIISYREISAEFFNFTSRTNRSSCYFNVRHHFNVEVNEMVVAFAVSDKKIAVIVPAKIIGRNFINVTVAFKLHFSVGSKLKILESYSFSGFYRGYDSVDIKADFFVFGFYLFINKSVLFNYLFACGTCHFAKFINYFLNTFTIPTINSARTITGKT